MSGGRKQRVAIARLIVKNPPIIIFDETTSAPDAQSEYHVKRALEDVMKGRTVLSITHRLSNIRACNHIAIFYNMKNSFHLHQGEVFRELFPYPLLSGSI